MEQGKVNDKVIVISIVLGLLIAVLFCWIVYSNHSRVETITIDESEFTYVDSDTVTYSLEQIGYCQHGPSVEGIMHSLVNFQVQFNGNMDNKSYIDISGWAVVLGSEIKLFNTHLLMRECGNTKNEFLKLSTEKQNRHDVTELFAADALNYDNCGFVATVPVNKIEGKTYDIFILYTNDDYKYVVETPYTLDVDSLEN